MKDTNVKVILRARPAGEPRTSDFEIVKDRVPAPGPGEVLCRTIYLSLDPYMRGRISGARSYAAPVDVGAVIVGGTVSEVAASNDARFAPGDIVLGNHGWQTHAVAPAGALRRLDPRDAPVSTALGVLGMPGMTAYVGLLDLGRPTPGETVVVSSASGAVGAVVGQLARIRECRVVGIAGSDGKCRYVVDDLGFDACLNYREADLAGRLREACPRGIDVYFENVGGAVLDAVMPLLNFRARIPLCGLIAEYNASEPPRGPNLRPILVNRASIQGFIVSDHMDRAPAFLADMTRWVREGRVKYREDIVDGLERAPEAFIGLLHGKNFGKMLVRVGPDPTR
jgi:NADPH-dependent curcumin reductase CurA